MTIESIDDDKHLATLNADIVLWEQRRDESAIGCLQRCISSDLIFRRADRTIVGKNEFMDGLKKPSPFVRRESRDIVVSRRGNHALVTVNVVTEKADGTKGTYRNVRVFSKDEGRWQLEVWFNDDVTDLLGR